MPAVGTMGETQECLNTLYILSQALALFPVSYKAVSGTNKRIYFTWKSFQTVYAVAAALLLLIDILVSLYSGAKHQVTSLQFGGF